MWIDDQVRDDTLLRKWHIFIRHNQTKDAFLPMPGCEFVPDLRDPLVSDLHLCKTGPIRLGYDNRIHDPFLV